MFYDRFEELCKKHGISPSKAAVEAGINKSAVTYWKNNASAKPSGQIAEKLCNYFGVTMGELYGEKETPVLTAKDERDIAKKLDEMLGQLGSSDGALMFDGEPLDDETRELLRASLKNQLEMTKRMAKQKYTPKKYRK